MVRLLIQSDPELSSLLTGVRGQPYIDYGTCSFKVDLTKKKKNSRWETTDSQELKGRKYRPDS